MQPKFKVEVMEMDHLPNRNSASNNKRKQTFTVRQQYSRDILTWQVGTNIVGDQSFYTRDFAIRCFEKLLSRGCVPEYIDGATDPRGGDYALLHSFR
jgi:hypothetical protein